MVDVLCDRQFESEGGAREKEGGTTAGVEIISPLASRVRKGEHRW